MYSKYKKTENRTGENLSVSKNQDNTIKQTFSFPASYKNGLYILILLLPASLSILSIVNDNSASTFSIIVAIVAIVLLALVLYQWSVIQK